MIFLIPSTELLSLLLSLMDVVGCTFPLYKHIDTLQQSFLRSRVGNSLKICSFFIEVMGKQSDPDGGLTIQAVSVEALLAVVGF